MKKAPVQHRGFGKDACASGEHNSTPEPDTFQRAHDLAAKVIAVLETKRGG